MRSLALALLAACGTPPRPPVPAKPQPPPAAPQELPAHCEAGELATTPPGFGVTSVKLGAATIELVKCRDVSAPSPDDQPGMFGESFHAYLVRTGDAPWVYALSSSVYQATEGHADVILEGLIPDSPILVLRESSGVMGVGGDRIVLYRVDREPEETAPSYASSQVETAFGEHDLVVTSCTPSEDPTMDACLSKPERVVQHTLRWVNGKLEVTP